MKRSLQAVQPRYLYKYFSRTGIQRFLHTRSIRFTPPCMFNDPFEALPALVGLPRLKEDKHFLRQHLHAALAKSIGCNVGMFCLSETPLNHLMWGHYGSDHRGGAIGFDMSHPFFSANKTRAGYLQWLRKVDYSGKRPELGVSHFQENKMGLLNDHGAGWLKLLGSEHPMFLTKSRHWSYEREWRLTRQLVSAMDSFASKPKARQIFTGYHVNDDYIKNPRPAAVEIAKVPPACIVSIHLGARSDTYTGGLETLEDEVWGFVSGTRSHEHIEIRKVRFHPTRFKLIDFDLRNAIDVAANVSRDEFRARSEGFEAVQFTK